MTDKQEAFFSSRTVTVGKAGGRASKEYVQHKTYMKGEGLVFGTNCEGVQTIYIKY